MSHALRACILIALDNNQGAWVTLRWLCKRMGMASGPLRDVLQQIQDERVDGLMRERVNGQDCYGIACDAASPVIDIDAADIQLPEAVQ